MSGSVAQLGAVVVAAGTSSRMHGIDKQVALLRGSPVISHSLRVFQDSELVGPIVLVMSADNLKQANEAVCTEGFSKIVATVIGGSRRRDSVKIGLDTLAAQPGGAPHFVAVHDGARPFVDLEMLERGLAAAKKTGAAVAAIPVKDTIKIAPHRLITETPDRAGIWTAQTPQIFRFDVLKIAHEITTADVPDDASVVESVGGLVGIFDGSEDNLKITTSEDLELAGLIFDRRFGGTFGTRVVPATSRCGIGFDSHRLINGGPLRLGGIDVEFDKRLEGHSDGDVLLHSIASAILGASGLGDLGGRFPSSEDRYIDYDSEGFITESAQAALQAGWLVEHVDATIIAQRPRLAAEVTRMSERISKILGLNKATINIKITSTDRVGAIGSGEGIAAQCVATLIPVNV